MENVRSQKRTVTDNESSSSWTLAGNKHGWCVLILHVYIICLSMYGRDEKQGYVPSFPENVIDMFNQSPTSKCNGAECDHQLSDY